MTSGTPETPPGHPQDPMYTPGSPLEHLEPLLNHPQNAWDPSPWVTPKTLGSPPGASGSPPECLEPPLDHPQDAWDPLGTPRSPLGCLGPPLHHTRDAWDPLWITPRISGSPLRCLSLLGGTLGGAPCAFTAQGAAPQQPRCHLPRGHRRRDAPFPCKNSPRCK